MHRSWFIFITPLKILTNVLNQLWLKTFSYLIDLLLQSRNYFNFLPLGYTHSYYSIIGYVGEIASPDGCLPIS